MNDWVRETRDRQDETHDADIDHSNAPAQEFLSHSTMKRHCADGLLLQKCHDALRNAILPVRKKKSSRI